jgi:hypothetical protein
MMDHESRLPSSLLPVFEPVTALAGNSVLPHLKNGKITLWFNPKPDDIVALEIDRSVLKNRTGLRLAGCPPI